MPQLDMTQVYQRVTNLLRVREGDIPTSYPDTKNYITGGIGHKMTQEEIEKYPYDFATKKGTFIPEEVRTRWWETDREWAVQAAVRQAREIGRGDDIDMVVGLASVNFQLGPNWYKDHKETWRLMKAGEWEKAAIEATDSDWYRKDKTKTRVYDFQMALRGQRNPYHFYSKVAKR